MVPDFETGKGLASVSQSFFGPKQQVSAFYSVIRLVDHLVAYTIRMYRFLVPCMEIYNKLSAGTGLLTRYCEATVNFTWNVNP